MQQQRKWFINFLIQNFFNILSSKRKNNKRNKITDEVLYKSLIKNCLNIKEQKEEDKLGKSWVKLGEGSRN